jgi:hypothetical protein
MAGISMVFVVAVKLIFGPVHFVAESTFVSPKYY